MVGRERDKEEVEVRDAGPARPSKSSTPRWYGDARVSLVMRAFEGARRNRHTGSYVNPAVAQGVSDANVDNDTTGRLLSVGRVRLQFDAATAAGAPAPEERSKTVDFVASAITTAVAKMLFADVSNANPARTVADHGVDSLIAAELRNWFHQALGTRISMQELLDARTSIAALASEIVDAALAK